MKINNMDIQIQQSYYNKTKLQQGGVTHTIDTSKKYPIYNLEIRKGYYDIDKEQVLEMVIADLEEVAEHLKRIKEREEER